MKKTHGLNRAVAPISRPTLEVMPTKALLARLVQLRRCEDAEEFSDLSNDEIASMSHLILFKSDTSWCTAFADLKEVLAGRENVPNKP